MLKKLISAFGCTTGLSTMKTKRVCVIGSGAAGLIAIYHIKQDSFLEGVVFEQGETSGGIWNYTEKTGQNEFGLPVHSTAYKGLRTNLPKEIMGYLEHPFPLSDNSYVSHEEVLEYLRNFEKKHDLSEMIKFKTRVVSVEPFSSDLAEAVYPLWRVITENLETKEVVEHHFDAVMVCNGHYTKPLIPDIKNMEIFSGEIIHSRNYRVPDNYKGKQVIVLGAGPSAIDISIEIAQVASKVMLSCKSSNYLMPSKISVHSAIVEANSPSSFITTTGEELQCDTLLLCSGYLYDFPFLSSNCGITVDKGKYIFPLYRHLINAKFPSMVFIGIPFSVCPFPQFDCQIRYCLKVFKGEIKLPTESVMIADIKKDEKSRQERNIPLHHSHKFGESQWEYNRQLAEEAGIAELIQPVMRKVYDKAGSRRVNDPANYKYDLVTIFNRENFRYIECDDNREKQN